MVVPEPRVVIESLGTIPEPVAVTIRQRIPRRAQVFEDSFCWSFRHTILERLDEYFICIRRLRRHDPSAYQLFRKIGFTVASGWYAAGDHPENRERLKALPRLSFGGVLVATDTDTPNAVLPSFLYFRRLIRPSLVQSFRGDVYALSFIFDDRSVAAHWASRMQVVVECHIGMSHDGTLALLKERVEQVHEFDTHSRGTKRHRLRRTSHHWDYPQWIKDAGAKHSKSPNDWATEMFVTTMLTHGLAINKFIIRARKGECVAAFGIALERAKTFFRDRDKTLVARDGKRKRIFHSVRAHTRMISTSQTADVRAHYRGLRTFDWCGYGMHIVLPEHTGVMKFESPGKYLTDIAPSRRHQYLEDGQVGEQLAEIMDR